MWEVGEIEQPEQDCEYHIENDEPNSSAETCPHSAAGEDRDGGTLEISLYIATYVRAAMSLNNETKYHITRDCLRKPAQREVIPSKDI